MKVYVAWSVDHMEGLTAAALMSDNVEELRRISGDLRRASENIKAWGIAAGGSSVLDLNLLGVMMVPPDQMTELPAIAQRFRDMTDGTISIGVGMSLSEAYVAMKHSQGGGGDRIALYDPSMEEHPAPASNDPLASLGKAQGQTPQPQQQDPKDQVTGYADNPSDFGLDENEIYADAEKAEKTTEQTPAAPPAASSAGAPDMGSVQPPDQDGQQQGQPGGEGEEDPRTVVVQALEKIKQQAPVLEQMKQTNPQAFDAVKSVVAAMILMAQGMAAEADDGDGGDVNKSEPSDLVQYAEVDDGHEHEWGKDEGGGYCLQCGGDQEAIELQKAGLPMPKPTPRRIVHPWPVGTMKEGKIKVAHVDPSTNAQTGTGWKEARAGMVMAPDGHPTSSRNPNGQ